MSILSQLIAEQKEDRKSRHVSKDSREITMPNTQLDKFPAKICTPAEIVEAKLDGTSLKRKQSGLMQ